MKTKRIAELQAYIQKHETVSLDELVEQFAVSKNTIRNDVQELVKSGHFKKIYGGVSVNYSPALPFQDRKIRNHNAKVRIAEQAARYVKDGDIVFIDSGTTTLEMVHFMEDKKVTIVTNNIDLIIQALPYENLTVYSSGGMLERRTKSLTSINIRESLEDYNINKAFLASTGISIKNGVTNSVPLESELKALAVKHIDTNFLVVDHKKFDQSALTTYCTLDKIDYLITDQLPSKDYVDFANKHNIQLVVAPEKTGSTVSK
ncbi:DeoR/GlpR family DNA-binding transcription regulator [Gracilibacillus sp. YIM 98692]|uniref:DeoR/GlpR family DNA-binding transcription regulator n=1 Tax=Gracilibacillus sp. YIM 98692 TaxID=2663532 RepID=UPI001F08FCBA|nr:DeoR/GlpR family DNA-binding transcription regulator [Gracilibacillus sp. YIM 98692]